MLKFVGPYRVLAVFALFTLVGMVILDLTIPRLIEHIIDQGIRKKDLSVVLGTSALMLAISALSVLIAVLNNIFSVRVGESVARDLREAIFVKVQGFSCGNLDRFSTGKIMVRLMSDTAAVQRLTQVTLRIGTRAPLALIGSIALMFVTSPSLACMMLPVLFLSAAIIVMFSARMEPLFTAVQQKLDSLNTVLQENIAGAHLVKSFVRADRENERFGEANKEFAGSSARVMQFMSSMSPLLTMVINVAMVLVVWIGGVHSVGGKMSVGQIIAFTNYLVATMNPLIMMSKLSNTWANGMASAKRIGEILDAEPDVQDADDAIGLPECGQAEVLFAGVGFHYNGHADRLVLEDVGLLAKPGETVAILGATGAGKSSLVNLIPRFYDVSSGSVRVYGADVRTLKGSSLRSRIAVIPQETILFSGTVRENIRFGRPDATETEVVEAARAAPAHDFIMRLPDGYLTRIEQRGVNLSGGQKQRIAIARAIVTRPDILIMDDSTSAVDVETETNIQTALGSMLRDCTRIVVAQRISTVLNADRIFVLDQGRIAAEGSHDELLRGSPIYREIFESQLGGGNSNGI